MLFHGFRPIKKFSGFHVIPNQRTMGLLFFVCCALWGAETDLRFDRLFLEEGLSDGKVFAIAQDNNGFMWFGTGNGLNRYDGYRFEVFSHHPEAADSLASSNICKMTVDSGGFLWVGTWGDGLDRFDPNTNRFQHFRHDPDDAQSLSHNLVSALFIDSRQTLWVGTEAGGLNRFLKDRGRFIRYQADTKTPNSLSNNRIWSICEDKFGQLWIATNNGLNRFDPYTSEFTHHLHDPDHRDSLDNNFVRALYADPQFGIWVGTTGGLSLLDPAKGTFKKVALEVATEGENPGISVNVIAKSPHGQLWVGSAAQGLYEIELGSGGVVPERIINHRHLPKTPKSLSHDDIRDIYSDRSGVVWIGTRGGGINKFKVKPKNFKIISDDNTPGLHSEIANSLIQDRRGIIWIGSSSGLNRFDPKDGSVSFYQHDIAVKNSLRHRNVISLLEDAGGTIWVGTGDGLDRFHQGNETFEHFDHTPDDPATITAGAVEAMWEDKRGHLWFATRGGLSFLDRETAKFTRFVHDPNGPNTLSGNYLSTVYEDRQGRLWVGTQGRGINLREADSRDFKRYRKDPANRESLSHDVVHVIFQDSSKRLWIGTEEGLNLYVPKTDGFVSYTMDNGLPNNTIVGILEDDQGNIWLSTANGLSRLSVNRSTFLNFDINDGLQSNYFRRGAALAARDGLFYFGGYNGLCSFLPRAIETLIFNSPVAITRFNKFNQPLEMEQPYSALGEIVLSHRETLFSFEFTVLDFTDPFQNRYKYMLEGYDEDWIYAGEDNVADYKNVPKGRYRFRVTGSNSIGIWTEGEATLSLRIQPAPWLTWWAYTGYVLVFLYCLVAYLRYMRRKLKKEQLIAEHLELAVKERTNELQEKNLALRNYTREMETLDGIVRAINQELVIDKVLRTLLDQGRLLLPQAELALYLAGRESEPLRAVATSGQTSGDHDFRCDPAVIKGLLQEAKESIEGGVYIINHDDIRNRSLSETEFFGFHSALIMDISVSGRSHGYLVMGNREMEDAFQRVNRSMVTRFWRHAITAVSKAIILAELKEKNEEIVRTQQQLVMQEKMASIGVLTAGVAHEIRNPLNFINNFAEVSVELIEDLRLLINQKDAELPVSEELEELVSSLEKNSSLITKHGKRANNIVEGMLMLSRKSRPERRLTDINALLKEYSQLAYMGMRAQKHVGKIAVHTELDESLEPIGIVPENLSRVVLNLVNNACYSVNLRSKKGEKTFKALVRVSSKNLGDRFEIVIRDNGIGIPSGLVEKIFTPFFTTKPPGEGTGLGLSISHEIVVEEHHGEIKVTSKPNAYTEFTLSIPKQIPA